MVFFWLFACSHPHPQVGKETGGGDSGEVDSGETADSPGPDTADSDTAVVTHDDDRDGYTTADDCNDHDDTVNPGRAEVCYNGVDDNCSGDADNCGWTTDMQLGAYGHAVLGAGVSDVMGFRVAGGGDFDGDGVPDLVTSAPDVSEAATGEGAVYVALGPVTDTRTLPDGVTLLLGGGDEDQYALGAELAFLPDTTGDGRDELVVVAARVGTVDDSGHATRAIRIVEGGTTGAVDVDGLPELRHVAEHDDAGVDVDAGPDLTGDGLPDLVIGAPGADAVYLLSGPTATSSLGDATVFSGDGVGTAVALLGDVDGDGVGDLAYGDETGDVSVLFGPPTSADLVVHGGDGVPFGAAGDTVRSGGDLDGDGVADLVLASPGATVDAVTGVGLVACLRVVGAAGELEATDAFATVEGAHEGEAFGSSVAGVDADSDGLPDLAVGATGNSTYDQHIGAVSFFAGPLAGTLAAADHEGVVYGENPFEEVGASLAAGADLTGDGVDDLLVGAPGLQVDGAPVGAAYVFPGITP